MIRLANSNDFPQLSILFNAYRVFYKKPSDPQGAFDFIKERVDKKEAVIFVEEENEKLIGFTLLYPQFSSTRMQKTWLLNDLYILPEYRGKGISRKFIEAAKQLAIETEAAGLLLETEKTNIIGNNLYPSAGFQLYNEINFYWWENK